MGEKSLHKKRYIVEKAKDVFHRMGYKAVTMKDIVEECDISRGGLYLYFSNVKELFEAVLEQEAEINKDIMESLEEKDITPGEMMLLYLSQQKKEILKKNGNLSVAKFEYMFDNKAQDIKDFRRAYFNKAVVGLDQIIIDGVGQEWMVCDNPAAAARNIVYTLEGLKVTAQTTGLTSDDMDKEIEYIMSTLGMVVE